MISCLFCFMLPNMIFAEDKAYDNGYASYKYKETTDEFDLGYGVKFHRDLASVAVTNKIACYNPDENLGKERPDVVNILDIAGDAEIELIPYAVLKKSSWQASTVRGFAAEYETAHPGEKVLAAINGDFFALGDDVPSSTGGTVSNGDYYKTTSEHPLQQNIVFKNKKEGKKIFTVDSSIDPDFTTTFVPTVTVYDREGVELYKTECQKVNEECLENEVSMFYCPVINDNKKDVSPVDAGDIWLVEDPLQSVASVKNGYYGKGAITAKKESFTLNKRNIFGVSSKNPDLNKYLCIGNIIRCQYEFKDERLKDVENMLGFPYHLITNNVPIGGGSAENSDINYHPRTAIGQREDGSIVLAVVDGRQKDKGMWGATGMEMAAMMAYYGCVDAWNLDGGGSSTMLVRKMPGWSYPYGYFDDIYPTCPWYVTNSPSQSGERADGNCLLVVVKERREKMEITSMTPNPEFLVSIPNPDKFDDFLIRIDDREEKVKDNKATFKDLLPTVLYHAFLVGVKDGKKTSLLEELYFTVYLKPTRVSADLKLERGKSGTEIVISYDTDNKESIAGIYFKLEDKKISSYDFPAKVESSLVFFDNFYKSPFYVVLKDEKEECYNDIDIRINLDVLCEEIKIRQAKNIDDMLNG